VDDRGTNDYACLRGLCALYFTIADFRLWLLELQVNLARPVLFPPQDWLNWQKNSVGIFSQ
jgi:hypothetical protein